MVRAAHQHQSHAGYSEQRADAICCWQALFVEQVNASPSFLPEAPKAVKKWLNKRQANGQLIPTLHDHVRLFKADNTCVKEGVLHYHSKVHHQDASGLDRNMLLQQDYLF
jgi:hypothetical protein